MEEWEEWKPEIIDEVLGVLHLADVGAAYYTTIEFLPGTEVQLTVYMDADDSVAVSTIVENARKKFVELQRHRESINQSVVDYAISLYNETWTQTPGEPMDRAAFVSQMVLGFIGIDRDGSLCSYEIGDLFSDHSLSVRVDAQGHIEDIHLAG